MLGADGRQDHRLQRSRIVGKLSSRHRHGRMRADSPPSAIRPNSRIRAVPSFVLEGKYLVEGAQSAEGFAQVLQQVAAELGVPVGTVKSRVYYALRALRLALEEMGWDG